jgi:hypothetical protein
MTDSIDTSSKSQYLYFWTGFLSLYLWSTSRVTAQYVAKIVVQALVLLAASVESLPDHL